MLQEDSNGESSFEIIDKKSSIGTFGDKPESSSSISSSYSVPSTVTSPGNLLSNVAPPSSLPDFTLWTTPGPPVSSVAALSGIQPSTQLGGPAPLQSVASSAVLPPLQAGVPPMQAGAPPMQTGAPRIQAVPPPLNPTLTAQQIAPPLQHGARSDFSISVLEPPGSVYDFQPPTFPPTQFSAAIPPNVGYQAKPPQAYSDNPSGGLMGWMKDAVSSGGLLSKVAEKAKNSYDSIITTLDPQMGDYMHAGSEYQELVVASTDEELINAVKDSANMVFGRAKVSGINFNLDGKNGLPIGFSEALQEAEKQIEAAHVYNKLPIVAVQPFIFQLNGLWFELSAVMLKDIERQVTLQLFSQSTPIPSDMFLKQAETEIPDQCQLVKNPDELLAIYLKKLGYDWKLAVSGVPRRDLVLLACKTLLRMYRNKIQY